jgi:hypothetical protein
MSSAHVYLRVGKGKTIDDVEPAELEDCAQLVKANSILGNKENNIYVVYTPWSGPTRRILPAASSNALRTPRVS